MNKALAPATQHDEDIRAEARLLAEEMALAAARFAETCWDNFKQSPQEMLKCPDGVDEDALREARMERLVDTPPENVQWWDLNQVGETDRDVAVAKWNEVKQHARDELRLGHRSAKFVEGSLAGPMERARFLALRGGFIEEWQPRGGVERALIDMLAQAFTMWEHWTETATWRILHECRTSKRDADEAGRWKRPLQSEADGIAMANEQADRWNRVFLRTLRQLRDLRRYSVNITAGQVSIAQHQVNAIGPPPATE